MSLRRVKETILVQAAPEAVWEVLADPHYTPKLYPDMLNIIVRPEGRVAPGQWRTLRGRAGKRLIEFKTVVKEAVPGKRLVIEGRRGGAFDSFSQVMELKPVKGGTQVVAEYFFKVSEAYFGEGFDLLTLEQMAVRNQEVYLKNLKELAELKKL